MIKKEQNIRTEMSREQEPAETRRKRPTTISQNDRMPLQTKPKQNTIINKGMTRKSTNDCDDGHYLVASAFVGSRYSEAADQNTKSNAIACLKRNKSL
jgi:hypothetical protein